MVEKEPLPYRRFVNTFLSCASLGEKKGRVDEQEGPCHGALMCIIVRMSRVG